MSARRPRNISGHDLNDAVRAKAGDERSPLDRAVLEINGSIMVKPRG